MWVWPSAMMSVCGVTLWRGGDEERLAAGCNLAAWALSMAVFKARSEETQWAVLAVDAAMLAVLLWLALRTKRHWPLFAAGFQLLAVFTHVAHAIDAGVSGWAYLTALIVWSYLLLLAIGYGAWTAPRYAGIDAAPSDVPGATRR